MAPNPKRHRKGKEPASTSAETPPADTIPCLSPWPKREDRKIPIAHQWDDIPSVVLQRKEVEGREITELWDDYDSLYYNEWLKVPLNPTRVADPNAMKTLGIYDDVLSMIESAGLGSLATKQYPMYPDLVKQFMATVRIYYPSDGPPPSAMNGTLTFFARGIRYRVSFPELCEIYGFQARSRNHIFPTSFPGAQDFWSLFATGLYQTRGSGHSLHTDIRHPAIRYMVRLLGNTLLHKAEPGKIRVPELVMLYHAFRQILGSGLTYRLDIEYTALSVVFAEQLVSLKTTPFSSSGRGKRLSVGSLLPPIFRYCKIDTSPCTVDTSHCTMDMDFMVRAKWIRAEQYWIFRPRVGESSQVRLPLPGLQSISNGLEALAFQPDETLLGHTTMRAPYAAPASSAPSAAPYAGSSGTAHTRLPSALTPAPEPQDDFQRWVIHKIQTIWRAVSRPRCGCVRPRSPSPQATSSSDDQEED